jgi:ABC-2 type transport system ATP-binding protein
MCRRVGILKNGRLIAEGSTDELRQLTGSQGESLEDIFLELTGTSETLEIIKSLEEGDV